MPIIEVKRQGVRPAVRKVPTSTCAVTMPMTLEQVGREVHTEDEEPEVVESLQNAFEKFNPQMKFKGRAGAEETEFQADLRFRSIKDFEPSNIMTRQEVRAEDGSVAYLRNDLRSLSSFHHLKGVGGRRSNRLLAMYVLPGGNRGKSHFPMQTAWRRD